jgi:hypothetical protein
MKKISGSNQYCIKMANKRHLYLTTEFKTGGTYGKLQKEIISHQSASEGRGIA